MRALLLLGIALIVLGAGCAASSGRAPTSLLIHGRPLILEFAQTPREQEKGLSGRAFLPVDHGMLFVFAATGTYAFWMQEMKIPIDLLWIQDRTVVGIEPHLPPPQAGEEPRTVRPPVPVNRVLELSAGAASAYHLQVGDSLSDLP